jgi:hypothetical protein
VATLIRRFIVQLPINPHYTQINLEKGELRRYCSEKPAILSKSSKERARVIAREVLHQLRDP